MGIFSRRAVAALCGIALPFVAGAATFTVTNTNDSGAGSLRAALSSANAAAGADTIAFNIPGGGIKVITPATELPASTTGSIYINGYSQPGYVGMPLIRIDGVNAPDNARGLYLGGASSVVRGLQITRFGTGISALADSIEIYGNYIGTDGSNALGNDTGIRIDGNDVHVGGTLLTSRNVISGNDTGIFIDTGVTGARIVNCYLGTNAAGSAAVPNSYTSIRSYGDGLIVGGSTAAERNLISGNGRFGVSIDGGDTATIAGNYVGTDATGMLAIPNGETAIDISEGNGHVVGGTVAAAGNLISGNIGTGVGIGTPTTMARVRGNRIGVNAAGNAALPNTTYGVYVRGTDVVIGGNTAGSINVISGNGRDGIGMSDTASNVVVYNNRIGTNLAGDAAIGNAEDGVSVRGNDIVVGPLTNLISGNGSSGITISAATGVNVLGNRIGTNLAGNAALGNGAYGVRIIEGGDIRIGQPGNGNLISANGRAMSVESADATIVQSNTIGLNLAETATLPNEDGVDVSSDFNQIGGRGLGEGNAIAGNDGGVSFARGSSNNVVEGNFLGSNRTETFRPGNGYASVLVYEGFDNLIGGELAGAGNVIAGNYAAGVFIRVGKRNAILGNRIFDNELASIDSEPVGPSLNDALDVDQGPNEGQNRPVLRSAIAGGNMLTMMGELKSAASAIFRIEFFHNAACHASGLGEGATYLGAASVTTDANGTAVIASPLTSSETSGFVTATATDVEGNTSEFSPCIAIGVPGNGKISFWRDPGLSYEDLLKATIPVIRSEGLEGSVSVTFQAINKSATAPSDFAATTQLLTFAPGEWLKFVEVPLVLDNAVEGDEAYDVKLSNPTGGAALGNADGEYLLFDHDVAYPFIVVNNISVTEPVSGQALAIFSVSLTSTDHEVKVDYATVAETATENVDFLPKSGVLTFPPSNTTTTFQIAVPVYADQAVEGDETFRLDIGGNSGVFIAAETVGEAVVKDGMLISNAIFSNGFEN